MKRPRLTLRSLMVAVVLAGLASWGYTLLLRSADYAAEAFEHRNRCAMHELCNTPMIMGPPPYRHDPREQSFHEGWIRYEDRLFRKYRFAAFLPFLPVSPEPPAPLDPLLDGPLARRVVTRSGSLPWNWFY